jgi:predicted DCC family thiol-disulfide oxidoreductase YuxK
MSWLITVFADVLPAQTTVRVFDCFRNNLINDLL